MLGTKRGAIELSVADILAEGAIECPLLIASLASIQDFLGEKSGVESLSRLRESGQIGLINFFSGWDGLENRK